MPQVLQVLDISEIWNLWIFEFFLMPKVNTTRSEQPTDHDVDVVEGRRYSSSGQER